ncbi:cellulose biosynthesis cyclic di-GMP-binding regulatory protein BcsB [Spongiibacter taiwanensis]|uniref:cellulose biosynthesis cyclic di-GMP-binding regulatory protein BcsB n=1 Tax=Spongiibacter taiwanensis TaxID=1748242 RepID=UPI0020359D65|nr:cellulose biosynthesis cyclic di-GMP-binding regulatory protein BcsB [Spongiibacter taiwanensis]USA42931.1 cellulose biosynthesis cyclic di-GMP-binding regulatory protein BcsB [Spongiibacter taiwanensis]
MHNGLKLTIASCLTAALWCFAAPLVAAPSQDNAIPGSKLLPEPEFETRDSLADLGFNRSLELQGSESSIFLGFGSRLDEEVVGATLILRYTASPALVEKLSQLKISLNNELQRVIAVRDDEVGELREVRVNLDPRYLSDYNQLRVELIGYLDRECWNPDEPSIWAEISQNSELVLRKRSLRLSNDLSLLPAPFYDERDFSTLTLPVVFGPQYALGTAKAAALAASYFGSLADWRSASFPLLVNRLPERHALVMVTNDNRPNFLEDFPLVEKPTLQIISHPEKPAVKLLLIQGKDEAQLFTAVEGLALGNALLSGQIAVINEVSQRRPRKPYDAPNWVRTDRPMRLGEMVDDLNQLEVRGRLAAPINVSMQLPPDLFTWQSRGIPLDLRYRYTPPTDDNSGSKMSFAINDQFVEAFSLTTSGENGELKRVRVPLLDGGLLDSSNRVRIPAFRVGAKNQMSFQFAFAATSEGACRTIPANDYRAVVEADSTVDFTGFPHYLEMPNLHAFVTAGYPFTRMADLSETTFVLSPSPGTAEVETLLNLAGFMGASSGYPGFALSVTDQWDKAKLRDRDVVVIAVDDALSKSMPDGDKLALILDRSERILDRPVRSPKRAGNFGDWSAAKSRAVAETVNISAGGGFAALLGAESPLTKDRSVVALLGASTKDLSLITASLRDSGKLPFMHGSVITFRGDKVASYQVGDSYFVGRLPLTQLIWYHFSQHPFFLAFCALLLIVLISIAIWRLLTRFAAKRVRVGDEDK